jgi:hypothetical protein
MAASASATGPFPFLFPNSPEHALAIANGGKARQLTVPPPPPIGVRGLGKINPAFVKQAVYVVAT